MRFQRPQLAVFLVSLGLFSALAVWLWPRLAALREGPTVQFVGDPDEVADVLRERAGRGTVFAADEPGHLAVEPIPEDVALRLFPMIEEASASLVYDPDVYFAYRPNLRREVPFRANPRGRWILATNELGLREDAPTPSLKSDLRVLVTGDSHTDGVCDNDQSFPHLLERALGWRLPEREVEVLNAGHAGWAFYHYLGAVEKHLVLDPDLVVVGVYGGNDFWGTLLLHHYFRRTLPEHFQAKLGKDRPEEVPSGAYSQALHQLRYFRRHPDEAALARDAAVAVSVELARICEQVGSEILFVYIPPMADAQPGYFDPPLADMLEAMELSDEDALLTQAVADAWIEALGELGIAVIDLRPVFEPVDERLYWKGDHHLNLVGNARVAEALVGPVVDRLRTP